jgi:hypothetical protein
MIIAGASADHAESAAFILGSVQIEVDLSIRGRLKSSLKRQTKVIPIERQTKVIRIEAD